MQQKLNTLATNDYHEVQLQLATEAAEIGTFRWDVVNGSLTHSARLALLFGYAAGDQLDHQAFLSRIDPQDRLVRADAHERASETGVLFYETRIIWADQSSHWLRINGRLIFDGQGKPLELYGTALDITNEKSEADNLQQLVAERTRILREQNEELRRSEERYHKMIEEVQDYAIILLDPNGIIQNWNAGAEKIKGYSAAEIVGSSFRIFYPAADQQKRFPEQLLAEAAKAGRALHEGWRVRKDGSKFWGSIVISALHGADGGIIGFSKVTRDLTERKLAEDKMRKYMHELEAQNRELEQFAYVASHDLQEPLRKIQIFIDVIENRISNNQDVSEYFYKIKSSANRMNELIKSVLRYSLLSKESEEKVRVNLNEMVTGVINDLEMMIQDKQARVTCQALPVLRAYPSQITQLFYNLIGNALKFNDKVPEIQIAVNYVDLDRMEEKPTQHAAGTFIQILLHRRQLHEQYRNYRVGLLAIAGIILFLFSITWHWRDSFSGDAHRGIFLIGLFGGGSIFAASLLKDLGHPARGMWLLALPATAGEKVFVAFTYATILYATAFISIFLVTELLFGWVIGQNGAAPEPTNLMKNGFYHFLYTFVNFQLLILIGTLVFKRGALLKTLLLMIAYFAASNSLNNYYLALLTGEKSINGGSLFDYFQFSHAGENVYVNLPAELEVFVSLFFRFLLPAVLYWVVYLKFRETKI